MKVSPLMYPDRCNIRPMISGGHGPGAEDKTVPTDPIFGVICSVQEAKMVVQDVAMGRDSETKSEIHFPDDDATRETIRGLEEDSVIEVTHRAGRVLPVASNAVVIRSVLKAVNSVAFWRVDCKTRV